MRFLPRSLLWRTVLTVLAVLLLSNAALIGVSWHQQREAVRDTRALQAAERFAQAVHALDQAPVTERPAILAGLQSVGFRAVLSERALLEGRDDDARYAPLRQLFADSIGASESADMVVRVAAHVPWAPMAGAPMEAMMRGVWRDHDGKKRRKRDDDHDDDHHHERIERLMRAWESGPVVLASIPLPGGGWLNAAAPLAVEEAFWTLPNLKPFFLAGVLLAAAAVFAAWRAVRPLDRFARAAERLGRDMDAPPMDDGGPLEVRRATAAFNRMQQRIGAFVTDRTRMLAAITHDLRTPITRMRLRAELMDDGETRAKMIADLDEMEAMINATLSFARDETSAEPVQALDLAALLQSVCDDAADAGGEAAYAGPARCVIEGRSLALKRAFANLVGNAVKFGSRARVALADTPDGPVITVDDDGPGLPEAELDAVFRPFYRTEKSRSRDTGGVGLGLSVVRAVVTAHGGEVTLENRTEGGLRATVRLPA